MLDPVLLFEIAENVTSSSDLDAVLERIGAVSKKLLACDASAIMLLDNSKKCLYFKVASGEKAGSIRKMTVPVGVGVAGWVAQNLRSVIIDDAAKDFRFTGQLDKTSGYVTRSMICVPMFSNGDIIGVVEVLNKLEGTFNERDMLLLTHLAGLAAVAITNARTIQKQRNFFSNVLEILSVGIEAMGPQFLGHPWRSQRLAMSLGRRLEMPAKDLSNLSQASLLHDIGYTALKVPGFLKGLNLTKIELGERLDPEKFHTVLGEKMLSGIELFRDILPLVRHHHEHYDGSGYPDRLKEKGIPLGARILALVEVVEEVCYATKSMTSQEIKGQLNLELDNLKNKKLDPQVVQAFFDIVSEGEILA